MITWGRKNYAPNIRKTGKSYKSDLTKLNVKGYGNEKDSKKIYLN